MFEKNYQSLTIPSIIQKSSNYFIKSSVSLIERYDFFSIDVFALINNIFKFQLNKLLYSLNAYNYRRLQFYVSFKLFQIIKYVKPKSCLYFFPKNIQLLCFISF